MGFLLRILADILRWIILLGVFWFFARFCFDPGNAPWTRAGRPPEQASSPKEGSSGGSQPSGSFDDTEA